MRGKQTFLGVGHDDAKVSHLGNRPMRSAVRYHVVDERYVLCRLLQVSAKAVHHEHVHDICFVTHVHEGKGFIVVVNFR